MSLKETEVDTSSTNKMKNEKKKKEKCSSSPNLKTTNQISTDSKKKNILPMCLSGHDSSRSKKTEGDSSRKAQNGKNVNEPSPKSDETDKSESDSDFIVMSEADCGRSERISPASGQSGILPQNNPIFETSSKNGGDFLPQNLILPDKLDPSFDTVFSLSNNCASSLNQKSYARSMFSGRHSLEVKENDNVTSYASNFSNENTLREILLESDLPLLDSDISMSILDNSKLSIGSSLLDQSTFITGDEQQFLSNSCALQNKSLTDSQCSPKRTLISLLVNKLNSKTDSKEDFICNQLKIQPLIRPADFNYEQHNAFNIAVDISMLKAASDYIKENSFIQDFFPDISPGNLWQNSLVRSSEVPLDLSGNDLNQFNSENESEISISSCNTTVIQPSFFDSTFEEDTSKLLNFYPENLEPVNDPISASLNASEPSGDINRNKSENAELSNNLNNQCIIKEPSPKVKKRKRRPVWNYTKRRRCRKAKNKDSVPKLPTVPIEELYCDTCDESEVEEPVDITPPESNASVDKSIGIRKNKISNEQLTDCFNHDCLTQADSSDKSKETERPYNTRRRRKKNTCNCCAQKIPTSSNEKLHHDMCINEFEGLTKEPVDKMDVVEAEITSGSNHASNLNTKHQSSSSSPCNDESKLKREKHNNTRRSKRKNTLDKMRNSKKSVLGSLQNGDTSDESDSEEHANKNSPKKRVTPKKLDCYKSAVEDSSNSSNRSSLKNNSLDISDNSSNSSLECSDSEPVQKKNRTDTKMGARKNTFNEMQNSKKSELESVNSENTSDESDSEEHLSKNSPKKRVTPKKLESYKKASEESVSSSNKAVHKNKVSLKINDLDVSDKSSKPLCQLSTSESVQKKKRTYNTRLCKKNTNKMAKSLLESVNNELLCDTCDESDSEERNKESCSEKIDVQATRESVPKKKRVYNTRLCKKKTNEMQKSLLESVNSELLCDTCDESDSEEHSKESYSEKIDSTKNAEDDKNAVYSIKTTNKKSNTVKMSNLDTSNQNSTSILQSPANVAKQKEKQRYNTRRCKKDSAKKMKNDEKSVPVSEKELVCDTCDESDSEELNMDHHVEKMFAKDSQDIEKRKNSSKKKTSNDEVQDSKKTSSEFKDSLCSKSDENNSGDLIKETLVVTKKTESNNTAPESDSCKTVNENSSVLQSNQTDMNNSISSLSVQRTGKRKKASVKNVKNPTTACIAEEKSNTSIQCISDDEINGHRSKNMKVNENQTENVKIKCSVDLKKVSVKSCNSKHLNGSERDVSNSDFNAASKGKVNSNDPVKELNIGGHSLEYSEPVNDFVPLSEISCKKSGTAHITHSVCVSLEKLNPLFLDFYTQMPDLFETDNSDSNVAFKENSDAHAVCLKANHSFVNELDCKAANSENNSPSDVAKDNTCDLSSQICSDGLLTENYSVLPEDNIKGNASSKFQEPKCVSLQKSPESTDILSVFNSSNNVENSSCSSISDHKTIHCKTSASKSPDSESVDDAMNSKTTPKKKTRMKQRKISNSEKRLGQLKEDRSFIDSSQDFNNTCPETFSPKKCTKVVKSGKDMSLLKSLESDLSGENPSDELVENSSCMSVIPAENSLDSISKAAKESNHTVTSKDVLSIDNSTKQQSDKRISPKKSNKKKISNSNSVDSNASLKKNVSVLKDDHDNLKKLSKKTKQNSPVKSSDYEHAISPTSNTVVKINNSSVSSEFSPSKNLTAKELQKASHCPVNKLTVANTQIKQQSDKKFLPKKSNKNKICNSNSVESNASLKKNESALEDDRDNLKKLSKKTEHNSPVKSPDYEHAISPTSNTVVKISNSSISSEFSPSENLTAKELQKASHSPVKKSTVTKEVPCSKGMYESEDSNIKKIKAKGSSVKKNNCVSKLKKKSSKSDENGAEETLSSICGDQNSENYVVVKKSNNLPVIKLKKIKSNKMKSSEVKKDSDCKIVVSDSKSPDQSKVAVVQDDESIDYKTQTEMYDTTNFQMKTSKHSGAEMDIDAILILNDDLDFEPDQQDDMDTADYNMSGTANQQDYMDTADYNMSGTANQQDDMDTADYNMSGTANQQDDMSSTVSKTSVAANKQDDTRLAASMFSRVANQQEDMSTSLNKFSNSSNQQDHLTVVSNSEVPVHLNVAEIDIVDSNFNRKGNKFDLLDRPNSYLRAVGSDLTSEDDSDSDEEHSFKRSRHERRNTVKPALDSCTINNGEECLENSCLPSHTYITSESCLRNSDATQKAHCNMNSSESSIQNKSICHSKTDNVSATSVSSKVSSDPYRLSHVVAQIRDYCSKEKIDEAIHFAETYIPPSNLEAKKSILIKLLSCLFSVIPSLSSKDISKWVRDVLNLILNSDVCDRKISSYFIIECSKHSELNALGIEMLNECQKSNVPVNTKALSGFNSLLNSEEILLPDFLNYLFYVKSVCKKKIPIDMMHIALEKSKTCQTAIHHFIYHPLLPEITNKEVNLLELKEFLQVCFKMRLWSYIASMFVKCKESLFVCFFMAFDVENENTGDYFEKFAESLYGDEAFQPNIQLKTIFGQIGTAVMSNAFSSKHMKCALEILFTLHTYNINYFDIQLTSCKFFFSPECTDADRYMKILPYSAVFVAVDICLHFKRSRDAFTIFQDYFWVTPDDKNLDESTRAYILKERYERLLKLVPLLNSEDSLNNGWEALKFLLTAIEEDLVQVDLEQETDFTEENLKPDTVLMEENSEKNSNSEQQTSNENSSSIRSIYNNYLISLINSGKVSSAFDLYQHSLGPKKHIFEIDSEVLRGLIVSFTNYGKTEAAKALFMLGLLKHVYDVKKPEFESFPWDLTIRSNWMEPEIKLVIERFIGDLFPILENKPKETGFENWFSIKIQFEDLVNSSVSKMKCLVESEPSLENCVAKTKNALQNMDPSLQFSEDKENALLITSESLYNYWKSRCSDASGKLPTSVSKPSLVRRKRFSFGEVRDPSDEETSTLLPSHESCDPSLSPQKCPKYAENNLSENIGSFKANARLSYSPEQNFWKEHQNASFVADNMTTSFDMGNKETNAFKLADEIIQTRTPIRLNNISEKQHQSPKKNDFGVSSSKQNVISGPLISSRPATYLSNTPSGASKVTSPKLQSPRINNSSEKNENSITNKNTSLVTSATNKCLESNTVLKRKEIAQKQIVKNISKKTLTRKVLKKVTFSPSLKINPVPKNKTSANALKKKAVAQTDKYKNLTISVASNNSGRTVTKFFQDGKTSKNITQNCVDVKSSKSLNSGDYNNPEILVHIPEDSNFLENSTKSQIKKTVKNSPSSTETDSQFLVIATASKALPKESPATYQKSPIKINNSKTQLQFLSPTERSKSFPIGQDAHFQKSPATLNISSDILNNLETCSQFIDADAGRSKSLFKGHGAKEEKSPIISITLNNAFNRTEKSTFSQLSTSIRTSSQSKFNGPNNAPKKSSNVSNSAKLNDMEVNKNSKYTVKIPPANSSAQTVPKVCDSVSKNSSIVITSKLNNNVSNQKSVNPEKNINKNLSSSVPKNISVQPPVSVQQVENSKPRKLVINRNFSNNLIYNKTEPKIAPAISTKDPVIEEKEQKNEGNEKIKNCRNEDRIPASTSVQEQIESKIPKQEFNRITQFLRVKVTLKHKDLSPKEQHEKALALARTFIKSYGTIIKLDHKAMKHLTDFAAKNV